jgi:hypothetical protein
MTTLWWMGYYKGAFTKNTGGITVMKNGTKRWTGGRKQGLRLRKNREGAREVVTDQDAAETKIIQLTANKPHETNDRAEGKKFERIGEGPVEGRYRYMAGQTLLMFRLIRLL